MERWTRRVKQRAVWKFETWNAKCERIDAGPRVLETNCRIGNESYPMNARMAHNTANMHVFICSISDVDSRNLANGMSNRASDWYNLFCVFFFYRKCSAAINTTDCGLFSFCCRKIWWHFETFGNNKMKSTVKFGCCIHTHTLTHEMRMRCMRSLYCVPLLDCVVGRPQLLCVFFFFFMFLNRICDSFHFHSFGMRK